MFTAERLLSFDKSDLQEVSKSLSKDDLPILVDLLSEKDDKVRYNALLLLQHRSLDFDDVYPFWDVFYRKLKSDNSYQRSIGLMLIADNTKWDNAGRFEDAIDDYLLLLHDEKPITVRQCIQSLCRIVPYKANLHDKIADGIMSVNIPEIKETMQKLVLLDILSVLAMIRKHKTADEIESYIANALSGGLLDKKAKKQVEAML